MSVPIQEIGMPRFVFQRSQSAAARRAASDLIAGLERDIRSLCAESARISRQQFVPENALLGRCLRPEASGPHFLEVLPTDLCNHACGWCFTTGSRSTGVVDSRLLRTRLEAFLESGGRTVLLSGGGEPLLFKPLSVPSAEFEGTTAVGWLARKGATVGVITNGVFLDRFLTANEKFIDAIAFIRVSLDAYTPAGHEVFHQAGPGDFARTLSAIREIIRMRGQSRTPAVGCSFLVDAALGLNSAIQDFESIDFLAANLGVDFVQIKHTHCPHKDFADAQMVRVGNILDRLPKRNHQWWIHRYLDSKGETRCLVPEVAQVLRSDGRRSPCCHLQRFALEEPDLSIEGFSAFSVVGCSSDVCRYVSTNRFLQTLERGELEQVAALERLKHSLECHGFHPYRLFPSSPDLVLN